MMARASPSLKVLMAMFSATIIVLPRTPVLSARRMGVLSRSLDEGLQAGREALDVGPAQDVAGEVEAHRLVDARGRGVGLGAETRSG